MKCKRRGLFGKTTENLNNDFTAKSYDALTEKAKSTYMYMYSVASQTFSFIIIQHHITVLTGKNTEYVTSYLRSEI